MVTNDGYWGLLAVTDGYWGSYTSNRSGKAIFLY